MHQLRLGLLLLLSSVGVLAQVVNPTIIPSPIVPTYTCSNYSPFVRVTASPFGLYQCQNGVWVNIGQPVTGVYGPVSYTATANTPLTITHNLNSRALAVTFTDAAYNVLPVVSWQELNANAISVTFTQNQTGYVSIIAVGGATTGAIVPAGSVNAIQTYATPTTLGSVINSSATKAYATQTNGNPVVFQQVPIPYGDLDSSLARIFGTITPGDCTKWYSSTQIEDAGACGSGSGPTLQTNSTNNGSQSLLNLIAGSNVTLSNSGGGVTINASGTGGTVTVQQQGQSAITGVSTIIVSNGTVTNNGGGSVTITCGGGGGSCAQNASQLGDFVPTYSSANGGTTTEAAVVSPVTSGGLVYTQSTSIAKYVSAGTSDTEYDYVLNGVRYCSTSTATITATTGTCTNSTGIAAFPIGSVQLYTWTINAGAYTSGGYMDKRSFLVAANTQGFGPIGNRPACSASIAGFSWFAPSGSTITSGADGLAYCRNNSGYAWLSVF